MGNKRDYQALKSPDVLVETISKYIELKKDGLEYRALCPFHHEKTPSFTVAPEKGFYHCFGCGARGDAIDFVKEYEKCTEDEAYAIVSGEHEHTLREPTKIKVPKPADVYAAIEPGVTDQVIEVGTQYQIYNPKRDKTSTFTPLMVFPYYIDGECIGYVIRLEMEGRKLTPFVRWCHRADAEPCWTFYKMPEPRPMYGQQDIKDGDRILVTEGEKAADAAKILLGHVYTIICWPYGADSVSKADWSCVNGHDLLLWPDMDEQGLNAMIGIHTDHAEKPGAGDLALAAGATSVRYINWDRSKPKGWDAADAIDDDLTRQDVIAWAKEYARDFVPQTAETIPHDDDSGGDDMMLYYSEYEQTNGSEASSNVVQLPAKKEKKKPWDEELLKGENGVLSNVHNAAVYLEKHPDMDGVLAYNEFDDGIYIMQPTPWDDNTSQVPRRIQDEDDTYATCWLARQYQRIGISTVSNLIIAIARRRSFDPVQNYLESLKWDGTKRIDTWLNRYLGVDDTHVHRAIGAKFLIGAAARALQPGCKMDNMLILEGSQGARKSSAVRELFGKDWFTDEVKTFDVPAELGIALQGAWGVEVAELSAMRKSDTNAVKKAISQQEDRYRPPYGRKLVHRPRRCVFIGTVNEDTSYLPDMTGNRRYWPVTVRNVDIQGLIEDRDQIWAEAVAEFENKERWWFDYDLDQELIRDVEETQERRESVDSWYETIERITYGSKSLSYADIYDEMKIEVGQRTRLTDVRVKTIMKKLGWEYKQRRMGGKRPWLWSRDEAPGTTENIFTEDDIDF